MTAFLDKLTAANKQNQIGQHRLLRELSKLEEVEKSDMRMLETARHRFRSRFKKFEIPPMSSGSDAIDVRMYDTHNPGFCYHCTGVIKATGLSPRERTADTYELVHSMLFTNGEVDPDKVLCLHLLAAHSVKVDTTESQDVRPVTSLLEKGKKERFTGAWNNVLPCYVVDIRRDFETLSEFAEELSYRRDPCVQAFDDVTINDFETRYKKYLEENSDFKMALATNSKMTRMVPNGVGKLPIISPHIYSLLGAAHELRIKQAIAEGSARRRFKRSSMDFDRLDDKSMSFRLDDDDELSEGLTTNTSVRGGWGLTAGHSKVSTIRSPSRRSTMGSVYRLDRSITTLKYRGGRSNRPVDEFKTVAEDKDQENKEVITIKPSSRAMGRIVSKTSSIKSPFQNILSRQFSATGTNSFTSAVSGPNAEPTKCKRCIYLNSPVRSLDLRDKEYRTVPILVNNQIQALVHSVLDVLERVNPEKMRKIVLTARDPYEIRKMMIRPDIQLFVDSLLGQPLVSSPDSFVVSTATVVDEIDPRIESSLEKELIALTLDMPPAPSLDMLVTEIRNNLFQDPIKTRKPKTDARVETYENLKEKFTGNVRSVEEKELTKRVFDLSTSCTHTNFELHKTSCAYCYGKWKESLPPEERAKIPDFSFAGYQSENCIHENAIPNVPYNTKPVICNQNVIKMKIKPSRVVNKATSETIAKSSTNVERKNSATKVASTVKDMGEIRKKIQSTPPNTIESSPKFEKQTSSDKTTKLPKIDGPVMRNVLPKRERESSKRNGTNLSAKHRENESTRVEKSSTRATIKKSNFKLQNSDDSSNATKNEPTIARDDNSRSSGQCVSANKTIKSVLSLESKNYRDTRTVTRPRESAMTIGGTILGRAGSVYNASLLSHGGSKITLPDRPHTPKTQFKPWKAMQDPGYLDPDRVLLRRLTNAQRILVGQLCASLKTKRINTEGLVRERTPLAALITPVLSYESLKVLTQGTARVKYDRMKPIQEEKEENVSQPTDKLTGPVLAKVRQEVAENETDRRLKSFLKSRV